MDRRCKFCNWLNKEVQEDFICKNCKLENYKEEIKEEIKEEVKTEIQTEKLKRRTK